MGYANGKDKSKDYFTQEEGEEISSYPDSVFISDMKLYKPRTKTVTLPVWLVWLVIALMSFMLVSQMWVVNTITRIYSLVSYQTGLIERKEK